MNAWYLRFFGSTIWELEPKIVVAVMGKKEAF
jgi:hypothetical protein